MRATTISAISTNPPGEKTLFSHKGERPPITPNWWIWNETRGVIIIICFLQSDENFFHIPAKSLRFWMWLISRDWWRALRRARDWATLSCPISKRATRYFIFAVSWEIDEVFMSWQTGFGRWWGPLVVVPGFIIWLSHHVVFGRLMTAVLRGLGVGIF